MAEARLTSMSRRARAGDDVVGQFLIGSEIGKGSFAQVYMGKHKVRTPSFITFVYLTFAPLFSMSTAMFSLCNRGQQISILERRTTGCFLPSTRSLVHVD